MKYGIVHHFPGGTKAQYDAVLKAVHVTKDSLPEGQLFHAAGQSAGGFYGRGGPRLQGELGAVPRHHLDAKDETGHQWRIHHSAAGNNV